MTTKTTRRPTESMQALLDFIRKRHAETGAPVTHSDIIMYAPIDPRHRSSSTCGLLERGLITVPRLGVAAYLPAEGAR